MVSQEQVAVPGHAGRRAGERAGAGIGLGGLGRRVVFAAFAGLILFGPGVKQAMGVDVPMLRAWVMFSGVGAGILRGEFVLEEDGRRIAAMSPLEALGLTRYPQITHYTFAHRVFVPERLAGYAAALCAEAGPGQRVAFRGHAGTRQGWRDMTTEDLCAPAPLAEAGR